MAGVDQDSRRVDGPPRPGGPSARRRFRCLTRPDKAARPIPDLVKPDFTAPAMNRKWCGDLPRSRPMRASSTWPTSRTWRHDGSPGSRCRTTTTPHRHLRCKWRPPSRWRRARCDLPLGSRQRVQTRSCSRRPVDGSVRPVDGAGRVMFRQCRLGELPLDARVRAAAQASLRHPAAARWWAPHIDRYNRTRRHSSCEMNSPIEFEAILAARTVTAEEAA